MYTLKIIQIHWIKLQLMFGGHQMVVDSDLWPAVIFTTDII